MSDVETLIEKALRVPTKQVPTTTQLAAYIVDDLGANGYVVVPRHLLEEVQEAIYDYLNGGSARAKRRMSDARRALIEVRRTAVVEAVGPTREDQKP